MNLLFLPGAWQDYQHWIKNDKQVLQRLNAVIEDALRSPFSGIGKPEPLKGNFSGFWSRRITAEHRLLYVVEEHRDEKTLVLLKCRFHY